MLHIPAGTFDMGSNAASGAPYNGNASTQPVHSVTISQGFYMGQHEVTQAEFQGLMGSNPSFFVGARLPVEQVSWNDARAYCFALTARESSLGNLPAGFEYRLPTEAEWEYACRAGTTTEFHTGPALFCAGAQINYSFHSNASCNSNSTAEVGTFPANTFGLHDMHGNVWEWCLDSNQSYSPGPVTDPFVTGSPDRILRGGSWFNSSNYCRSAGRFSDTPDNSGFYIGFRVVLGGVLVP